MKTLLSMSFLLFLGSCANYVQSLHRQIDYEERMAQQKDKKATPTQNSAPYAGYYQGQYPAQTNAPYAPRDNRHPSRRYDKRPIQNPITLQNVPSAQTSVQRNNYADGAYPRRYTADDLRDNDSSGSLWAEKNGGTYLFTTSENIKRGDFVVIEVLASLKDDIQEELKRAYPEPTKKKDDSTNKKEEETSSPPSVATTTNSNPDTNKVYDKISTQVVDEVNQNYLFVRGRKEVIFRGAKRYIEIQAVVPRKDIKDTDTVRSDKILQPRIFALRY